jgi:hypothetical protein
MMAARTAAPRSPHLQVGEVHHGVVLDDDEADEFRWNNF